MADISDDIDDWSATAASNSPSGATSIGTGLDDNLRAIQAGVKAWQAKLEPRLTKAIYGLTYANNGSDATNDIDVAVGGAMDSTGAYWIRLASAITKRLDAAWAVGTNQGGLDTGSIGDSDYYIWLICRSDTGVVDVLFSLSSTAPTMPTNYDYKRLIGWFKRVGGSIVAFHTYETEGGGIEHNWDTLTADVSLAATLTTSRRTDAIKVPLNFSVLAHVAIETNDAAANTVTWVGSPDHTDAAPGFGTPPVSVVSGQVSNNGTTNVLWIRTSATGTIAARSTTATIDNYCVSTIGFRWARRN
jgi:hypothetical protein